MITVADLRARIADVLTTLEGPLYVTQRGEPRAVLLSADDYHALTEQLEYLYDSLEGALGHVRLLEGETTRPLEDVLRELDRTDLERAKRRERAQR